MTDPHTDFSLQRSELRAAGFLLLRNQVSGGVYDEHHSVARTHATAPVHQTFIRIFLEGRATCEYRDFSQEMSPGSVAVGASAADGYVRGHQAHSDHLVLAVRSPGVRINAGSFVLSPSKLDFIRSFAQQLTHGDAGQDLEVLLQLLRAEGLPIESRSWTEIAGPEEPGMRRVAEGLSRVLHLPELNGAGVDLASAMQCSERNAMRLINQWFERYYFTLSSWRGFVKSLRLLYGATAITNPNARTEWVSKRLGYSNPTALCHAFSNAGLPSPQRIAEDCRPRLR